MSGARGATEFALVVVLPIISVDSAFAPAPVRAELLAARAIKLLLDPTDNSSAVVNPLRMKRGIDIEYSCLT